MHFPLDFSLDHLESLPDAGFFFRMNRQYIIHYSSISKIYVHSKAGFRLSLNPG